MSQTAQLRTLAEAPTAGRVAVLAAVAASLAMFGLMQVLAALKAGWVFEYPLDDVYIHLAMAREILRGGYGINPGEFASAASSPLYPVLLAPFTLLPGARLAPLALNLLGLVLAAGLFARIVMAGSLAASAPRLALALAVAVPLALNLPGLAFTGMEHALHVVAVLAVVEGLLRINRGAAPGWTFWAGVLLSPLLRLEGLGLGLLAALWLLGRGDIRRGLIVGGLSALPVAGFAMFLRSLGLAALPNSVTAKIVPGRMAEGASELDRLMASLNENLSTLPGLGLGLLVLLALGLAVRLGPSRGRSLALVGAGVGAGHLLLGQIGWLDRYEVYAAMAMAALVLGLARGGAPALALALVAAVMATGYARNIRDVTLWSPRGIHLQQAQMAAFLQGYWPGPVAVNDIGLVAWSTDNPVLDLWGLANAEALHQRLGEGAPGWAGPMVRADGAELAMVYTHHLERAIPEDWQRLGDLVLVVRRGFLGGDRVSFYATTAAAAATLPGLLALWAEHLPEGARWEPAEGRP